VDLAIFDVSGPVKDAAEGAGKFKYGPRAQPGLFTLPYSLRNRYNWYSDFPY
jgi:hypothetical protein